MKTPIPIILVIAFSFLFCYIIYPIEHDPVFKDWLHMEEDNSYVAWCGNEGYQLNTDLPEGTLSRGRDLFKNNCASCHNMKMEHELTGPPLWNFLDRVPSREWAKEWIRNSSALIAAGDPYALKIYEDYNRTQMTAMEHLTDQDLEDILNFIESYHPASMDMAANR